ncbi:aldehyde dehydrogenase [Nadsonia fulvescens var. elongata DSM 6958]|uniref:Aldehyde dehydrogenase n=1 Tax=Nadsonia fulvescens var. elongata DSM 6958 TaxID=857566 RepID=A0A1E3PHV7_9ASCO|nr:aldehyde dehydrogenase [Nadsonia fulvescens var. elongata DSM 6958]
MSSPTEIELTTPSGLSYKQPVGLFINNEFVLSKEADSEPIQVYNPSTHEEIVKVQSADKSDVDVAVSAARNAFNSVWRDTEGSERSRLLYKLVELLERDHDILSQIEAWDSGKPYYANAKGDVTASITNYRYYAGWADNINGRTIEASSKKFAYTLHEPYGVCGQIIPWNYPMLMASWKVAPAIAAGNCIILKLAENTPLSMLYFAKLVVEAGFPPGVINIFTGLGSVSGAHLSGHEGVDKIAFTGSTATGRAIMKLAANTIKNITLECGGKSPMLIFEDADLDQAVKWAHGALFSNMGQICTAISRVYIHESIYEKFIVLYKQRLEEVSKVGGAFDESVFQGPQVSKLQQEKILDFIKIGKKEGARLVTSEELPSDLHSEGYYVPPTIFADVSQDMTIMREEIFGPVAALSSFSTQEEAITKANDSEYGLAASIFTQDITRAHNVAKKLESGQVFINSGNDSDYRIPFGGYKMSGIGRELGEYGLINYTQTKAVHVNLGLRL